MTFSNYFVGILFSDNDYMSTIGFKYILVLANCERCTVHRKVKDFLQEHILKSYITFTGFLETWENLV